MIFQINSKVNLLHQHDLLCFIFLVLACYATFGIIGTEIAPDGRLVEPFFLLPIGYLLDALSIIAFLIIRIQSSYR